MPVLQEDFYEVIVQQQYLGQACQNRFCLEVINIVNTPDADEFIALWAQELADTVNEIQCDALDNVGGSWLVYNASQEFGEFSLSGEGSVAEDGLPPFVTYTFTLKRATKSTRNGRKAFSGVTDQKIQDGVWTATFAASQEVQDVEDFILNDQPYSSGADEATFRTGIASFVGSTSGLPTNYNTIQNVFLRANPSTQNSRKVGVGI